MTDLQEEFFFWKDKYYERFGEGYGIDITGSETMEEAIETMKHCVSVGRKAVKEEPIPGVIY